MAESASKSASKSASNPPVDPAAGPAPKAPSPDHEAELAELVSQLTDRQNRGEQVLLGDICEQHPRFAADLKELWPAIELSQVAGDSSMSHTQTGQPDAVLNQFELPCQFGDFQLQEELGRGGMGIVFKARQRSLDRDVALKMILKGKFADDEERRRFRSEATAAAKITHPNIVSITEVGEQEGHDYFCMEYIRGGTLSDRLADGPMPPRDAARMVADIARAIAVAHRNGVLHRDLKPSNILIGTSGTPYVADFGLAKLRTRTLSYSQSESVIGTPAYMAPEQVARARGTIGPQSDIYSLGAMLYHMIVGHAPFQAASPVELMMMVLEEDPVPVRVLNRNVDRDLEMIVMKCLQKPQDLRYETADQLASDLQAYLRGESISARDGRFASVIANTFRETHHASVLEHWGVLWMWHSLILLIACLGTNVLFWVGFSNRWKYFSIWSIGFGTWALVFWWLRRRMGPVTFVERQIAHVWFGSMMAVVLLFPLEYVLGQEVLSLAPVLAVVAAMAFIVKAGILSGQFFIHAAVLFLTAFVMAWLPNYALTIFGIVSAACFFLTGLKYERQRQDNLADLANEAVDS